MKKTLTLLAMLAATLVASTTSSFAQKGGVAVIDIDAVATALNVDKAVLAELQGVEANLNGQLQQRQVQMQQQFDNARTQAGEAPTPQQQQALLNYNKQLNGQFNQIRTQAQQMLTTERIKKINDFREELSPIALAVAQSKGLAVVLSKTQQVFAHTDASDITKEVIAKAKAAGLEKEVPATPAAPAATTPAATPAKPATTATPVAPKPEGGKAKGKAK